MTWRHVSMWDTILEAVAAFNENMRSIREMRVTGVRPGQARAPQPLSGGCRNRLQRREAAIPEQRLKPGQNRDGCLPAQLLVDDGMGQGLKGWKTVSPSDALTTNVVACSSASLNRASITPRLIPSLESSCILHTTFEPH